jgi:hypothetical protein
MWFGTMVHSVMLQYAFKLEPFHAWRIVENKTEEMLRS